MTKTVSTSEARAGLGDLLGSVYYTRQPVIIARKGKPVAVVINPIDYERFLQLEAKASRDTAETAHQDAAEEGANVAEADVAALLADIEAIRRMRDASDPDGASRPLGRPLSEIAAELAHLEWPDEDFADDLEAVHALMNQPVGLPPEWPS